MILSELQRERIHNLRIETQNAWDKLNPGSLQKRGDSLQKAWGQAATPQLQLQALEGAGEGADNRRNEQNNINVHVYGLIPLYQV